MTTSSQEVWRPATDRTTVWSRRSLLAAASAAIVLVSCEAPGAPLAAPIRQGGPLAHPARGIWPDVLLRAPAEARSAYGYAALHPQLLRFIPCYCGCVGDGHTSNYDCYVREQRADGWFVLDGHGLG